MQELTLFSDPFLNQEKAFDFLSSLRVIKPINTCPYCNSQKILLVFDEKYQCGRYYKCSVKSCRKRINPLEIPFCLLQKLKFILC